MAYLFNIFAFVVIGIAGSHFRGTSAEANSSTRHWRKKPIHQLNLTVAWIERPPYLNSPSNESIEDEVAGLFRDVVLKYLISECDYTDENYKYIYNVRTKKAQSEFEMIELLRQDEAHIAAPIFKQQHDDHYSEFLFFKVLNYPGTEYITTAEEETRAIIVVFNSLLKSWPLLAFTLILTAIAGIIIWVLDSYWNSEEFSRSFFRGSWDGFWWSFISMTTVGYGDKAPKSVLARIFSVIWIQFSLIIMAVFTANVTSALTALSLHLEPTSLDAVDVAVLSNGTEYQHALEENARPKVFNSINDAIEALESKQVNGMLLDRYAASYYQRDGKLESLITVKKLDLQRDIGALFHNNRKALAECLTNNFRSDIWRSVQGITDSYKLTQERPPTSFNLFDESSPFVRNSMYTSLGVLAILLVIGMSWEVLIRLKGKGKRNFTMHVDEVINKGRVSEGDTVRAELEVMRRLLRTTQEQFDKLESKVFNMRLK